MNDVDLGAQLDALRRRDALLVAGQELAGLVTLEWYLGEDRVEWSRPPDFLLGPRPPGGFPLVRELVHPEDREAWLEARDRAVNGDGPGPSEYRLIRTDGEVRWVAHVQRVSQVVDGRPTRVTVVLLDVTERRRAQDRETRLLANAVENLEESFSLCDPEGRYVVTNRRFRENNAAIAEHIRIGSRYEDAVRAAVRKGLFLDAIGREDAWIEERMAHRRERRPSAIEQHRKDDRWVLIRETHLADGSVITLGLDITERKRAEERLRQFSADLEHQVAARSAELAESEALLRLVTANVPVGIGYYDRDRRLRFANTFYAKSMGYDDAAPLIGRRLEDLFPAALLDEYQPYIARAIRGEVVRYEAQRQLDTVRTGENILVPEKGPDGEVSGVFIAVIDVTKRKRAEGDLKRSLSLLEATLESTADGVLVVDAKGSITRFNRRFATLWGIPDEILASRDDQRALAFVLEQLSDPAAFTARVQDLYDHPETESFDSLSFKDGRVIERYSRPQRVEGTVVGRVWSFRDVTARAQAEAAVRELNAELEARVAQRTADLAAANRELEAFSYTVSHDLRAPARAVAGFSEILLADHAAQLDADGRRLLQRMSDAGERMGEMIDGLLRLARISRAEVARAPLDLGALARTVWDEVVAAEPGRTVEFCAPEGVRVSADPVLMRNVLQNLLGNAFKYTRPVERGRVEFGALAADGGTVYRIRDNGVGFDMAHAAKLFGVFQRMHGYDDFEGTGVGLATAQRIVARHGGRIWANARTGEGATFYFTLG